MAAIILSGLSAWTQTPSATDAFREFRANENPEGQRIAETDASGIVAPIARTIDAAKTIRPWPDLTGCRNTSLQKAPAPALAAHSAERQGRPAITRCFLNLDEVWDYRTRTFDFNRPIGVSMQFLGWHKGQEIEVENSTDRDDLVLASADGGSMAVHVVNYGGPRPVEIRLRPPEGWRGANALRVEEYLLDGAHNNNLSGTAFSGGARKTGESQLAVTRGEIALRQAVLEANGILFWRIRPEE
jgi:hypothetical protein